MSERRVYDHIVGLGFDCRVAYNLRRTFGFDRAFPFDWWVTPLPALAAFLREPSVERLYDPRHLRPFMARGGIFAIRNVRYDIELHHEFPRGEDGLVKPDWADHIAQAKARSTYLWRRLLTLPTGSRLLFVRSCGAIERKTLPADEHRRLAEEVRLGLEAILPGVDFELLLINSPARVDAPGVLSLRIDDPNKDDWRGTPELWTAGLRAKGLAWAGSPRRLPELANPEADHDFLAGGYSAAAGTALSATRSSTSAVGRTSAKIMHILSSVALWAASLRAAFPSDTNTSL